jgi:hypothetical protein
MARGIMEKSTNYLLETMSNNQAIENQNHSVDFEINYV